MFQPFAMSRRSLNPKFVIIRRSFTVELTYDQLWIYWFGRLAASSQVRQSRDERIERVDQSCVDCGENYVGMTQLIYMRWVGTLECSRAVRPTSAPSGP